jgi:heme/copper-type cytochrome/quinol oxidase subunit 2
MTDHHEGPFRRIMAVKLIGRLFKILACLIILTVLAILLNAAMFRFFGGVQGWQIWRADHYWHLLAWRITFYAFIALAWHKLKTRARNDATQPKNKRLRRVEILAVLLVSLIELSRLVLQQEDFL